MPAPAGPPWPLSGRDALRESLLAAYDAPGRHYHDLTHLADVLDRVRELVAATDAELDLEALLLAAWFHDAVYDGRPGAEERSARWAEESLPAAGVPAGRVAEVARLVRITEQHRPAPDDPEGCVLSDADLAILASPEDRYAGYTAAIRREYAHVPDARFASGRAAVLQGLLAGPAIFATEYGRERWEARARRNLTAELAHLRVQ